MALTNEFMKLLKHASNVPLQTDSSSIDRTKNWVVVCISDTHTKHGSVELPQGDILIHAGDFTYTGSAGEVDSFAKWMAAQPFEHKIVVAGNHELTFESPEIAARRRRKVPPGAEKIKKFVSENPALIYLEDQSVTVKGYKFYGSPYQPEFEDWAFNLETEEELREKWASIPSDTEILITHGPPFGHCDVGSGGNYCGCPELLRRVRVVKPMYHIFGHIHEAYGCTKDEFTQYINASICTLYYRPTNRALVFALPKKEEV